MDAKFNLPFELVRIRKGRDFAQRVAMRCYKNRASAEHVAGIYRRWDADPKHLYEVAERTR